MPPNTDHVFNVVAGKASPTLLGMPLGSHAAATILSSQRDLRDSAEHVVRAAVAHPLDTSIGDTDSMSYTVALSVDGREEALGYVGADVEGAVDAWNAQLAHLMRTELMARAPGAVQQSWWCTCQMLAVAAHYAGIELLSTSATPPHHHHPRHASQHTASVPSGPDTAHDAAMLSVRSFLALACAQLPVIAAGTTHPVPAATTQLLSDDIATFRSCHMQLAQSVGDFVGNLMPLLIDEPASVQDCALQAVRWLGPESYLHLSEAMVPLVRDSFNLRSESSKKKRRRDRTRAVMAELHNHTSAAAATCLQNPSMPHGVLLQRLSKFITGTRSYLEIESESDMPDLVHLRLQFCMAITAMIEHLGDEHVYAELFPDDVRTDLFTLMSQWRAADPAPAHGASPTPRPRPDALHKKVSSSVLLPSREPLAADDARLLLASAGTSGAAVAGMAPSAVAPGASRYSAELVGKASAAVAALCRGRAFDYAHSIVGDAVLLRWIERTMCNPAPHPADAYPSGRACAYTAITHLLRDTMDTWVCAWVVAMCHHASPHTRFTVFSAFSHVVRARPAVCAQHETQSLCLALLMLADELPSTQAEARRLLVHMTAALYPSEGAAAVHIGASSTVLDTRLHIQRNVSAQLVLGLSHLATAVQSTLFSWLMGVDTTPAARLQLCGCLVPWLSAEDLVQRAVPTAVAGSPTVADAILTNLVCLHVRFGAAETGVLWRALAASHGSNLTSTIDLLVCVGNQRGGASVDIAKDVCATLASLERDKVVAVLIDILEAELCRVATTATSPIARTMADGRRGSSESIGRQRSGSYNWGVDHVEQQRSSMASVGNDAALAEFYWPPVSELLPLTDGPLPMFNIVFWILEEVNLRCGVRWHERSMTLFLHYACLGLDHPASTVRQRCGVAIATFLAQVHRTPDTVATQVDGQRLRATLQGLESPAGSAVPTHAANVQTTAVADPDEVVQPRAVLTSAAAMAQQLCAVFPGLARVWMAVALDCATSCTTCAYAGHSLAVLRALHIPLGAPGLDDLLVRLSDSAADTDDDIQDYTQEILLTLVALPTLVRGRDADAAVDTLRATTRLWLTAVALLDSDYEDEFALACALLLAVCDTGLLAEGARDAPDNAVPLLDALAQVNDDAALPAGGRVHRTLCRGLSSPRTVGPCLAVLCRIARLVGHPALDHPASHVGEDLAADRHGNGGGVTASLIVAALLVSVVQGFDARTSEAVAAAEAAAHVAQAAGAEVVARLFRLYHEAKYFRSRDLWVKDVHKHFAKHFFPACEVPTLCMLVGAFETQTDPEVAVALAAALSALAPFVALPGSYAMFRVRLLPAILRITAAPHAFAVQGDGGGRVTSTLASPSDESHHDVVQSPSPPPATAAGDVVDSTRIADMHQLLRAVAAACNQQLRKHGRGRGDAHGGGGATPLADAQLLFMPAWDTPGACQRRVRAGLKAALDACGMSAHPVSAPCTSSRHRCAWVGCHLYAFVLLIVTIPRRVPCEWMTAIQYTAQLVTIAPSPDMCVGLADESKDKVPRVFVTPRASVSSILSAGDDGSGAGGGKAKGYVSRASSSEQVLPKSSSESVCTPSLEVCGASLRPSVCVDVGHVSRIDVVEWCRHDATYG